MESFFSRYKNALVLMLVVLAQVVLLAMQVRRPAPDLPDGHNVRLWRYLVSSVVTPPARLAHGVGLSVRGVWSNYLYLRHLREQNQDLKQENDRLRIEQASLAEDARAGQRLREMLDFRGRYIDKTLPAQVIGSSGTDQAKVIIIDKGSKDGIEAQMPVITPDGIVGKVKNVFPHSAQILLISDQTSGTGVILQTTRIRGVMKGNASGQPQLINISPDERIQPGEPVVTSGGDQVYPTGMPIGVVEKVTADPETSYVNVVVKPNSDLGRLEEVLVVTGFSDKAPFAQQKDVAQSEVDAQEQRQRASDILSEKLPSIRDANAPDASGGSEEDTAATDASAGTGDPARPVRPPQPLRPDRYTPGAAPSADSLTPGQAPPATHREPTAAASTTAVAHAPKPTVAGTEDSGADRAPAVASRFPAKLTPNPVAPAAAKTDAAGAEGAGSTLVKAVHPTGPGNVSGTGANAATPAGSTIARTAGSAGSTTARAVAAGPGTAGLAPKPASKPTTAGAVVTSGGIAVPRTATNTTAATSASKPVTRAASGTTATIAPAQGRPSTSTQTPQAAGPAATAANPRRPAASADASDGILTPAGMGSIGGTPRPRPAPAAGTAPAGTAVKPAPAKSKTPAPAAPGQPATAPPGGA